MDCNLARQLLEFASTAELEATDAAALERHVQLCPHCGPAAGVERAFNATLARGMRQVPLPGGLRDRLQFRLRAARAAWWRHMLLRALTGVVALMLAVSVSLHFGRPSIDTTAVIQKAYEMTGPGHANDEVRDAVTTWLRQYNSSLLAPDEFNYKLLFSSELSDFQGRRSIPTMLFVRNEAFMRVYVVRNGAFKNLQSLVEQTVEESGCRIAARNYAEMPGWVFITVTFGAPPGHFLRSEKVGIPF